MKRLQVLILQTGSKAAVYGVFDNVALAQIHAQSCMAEGTPPLKWPDYGMPMAPIGDDGYWLIMSGEVNPEPYVGGE